MAYRIKISPRAEWDLAWIYHQIRPERSELALKWHRGLRQAIRGLSENPERCPMTPEDPTLRHLLYGKSPYVYRTFFRIGKKRRHVEVIHIRHGAQRPFTPADLN